MKELNILKNKFIIKDIIYVKLKNGHIIDDLKPIYVDEENGKIMTKMEEINE